MNYRLKMFVADVLRETIGIPVTTFDRPDPNPAEWMEHEDTHDTRIEGDGSETRRVTQTWQRRNGTTYTRDCAVNRPTEFHSYREVKW